VKFSRVLAVAVLFCASAFAAKADSYTPVISLESAGSALLTPGTIAGTFLFNGQTLDFQNQSGQTYTTLTLTLTPVTLLPGTQITGFGCNTFAFFSTCSTSGDTVTFSGGGGVAPCSSSFFGLFCSGGTFALQINGMPTLGFVGVGGTGNPTAAPEPEPILLLLTGIVLLGYCGLRKRFSNARMLASPGPAVS
jgi:hypothetical protein